MRVRSLSLMSLMALLSNTTASAADGPRGAHVRHLNHDIRIDTAVVATGALWLVGSEFLKADLVSEKCRWCYRRPDGASDLNAVDGSIRRSLKWSDANEKIADRTSSVIGFALMPTSLVGLSIGAAAHDGVIGEAPVDVLLTAQATILAADLNQLVKLAFARERPFVHYMPRATDGVRALTDSPSDDNLSFYSGHTNLAFALAASSGTVSVMRGYRLAPVVLGVGFISALAVAYLRIAADKHYFSDVMVGAVLGSAIGAGVPLLFHRASGNVIQPSASAATSTAQQPLMAPPLTPMSTPFVLDGVW